MRIKTPTNPAAIVAALVGPTRDAAIVAALRTTAVRVLNLRNLHSK